MKGIEQHLPETCLRYRWSRHESVGVVHFPSFKNFFLSGISKVVYPEMDVYILKISEKCKLRFLQW